MGLFLLLFTTTISGWLYREDESQPAGTPRAFQNPEPSIPAQKVESQRNETDLKYAPPGQGT